MPGLQRIAQWARVLMRALALFPFLLSFISFLIGEARSRRQRGKEIAARGALARAIDESKTTLPIERWFTDFN